MYMAILAITLAATQAGCVSVASDAALCGGTEAARREHAAALAADGGDRSVLTGARLIRLMDAGCN